MQIELALQRLKLAFVSCSKRVDVSKRGVLEPTCLKTLDVRFLECPSTSSRSWHHVFELTLWLALLALELHVLLPTVRRRSVGNGLHRFVVVFGFAKDCGSRRRYGAVVVAWAVFTVKQVRLQVRERALWWLQKLPSPPEHIVGLSPGVVVHTVVFYPAVLQRQVYSAADQELHICKYTFRICLGQKHHARGAVGVVCATA